MSFVYNNEVKYSDSLNLDAFGRLRTSGITSLLEIKYPYDKQPLLVSEATNGASTSIWSNSSVQMTVTNNADFVVRQSKNSAIYQPGKGQIFEASFSNFHIQSNVIKRVGYFTTSTVSPYNSSFDGFFLESDGSSGVISFQIWKGGSLILKSNQADWLTDDYDSSLIDFQLTQLMFVDFQWLGVGRMRFALVVNGVFRVFVVNSGTNFLSGVYMLRPNQPIRYEIRSTGGSGQFYQICSQVSMEGSINSLYKQTGIGNFTERTLLLSGTTYPILGARVNPAYRGIDIIMENADILQTSNDNYVLSVQINPSLSSSPTWTGITNTPVQYAQGDGSITVTSPGFVIANYLGFSGSLGTNEIKLENSSINPGSSVGGTSDEMWICIEPLSANSTFRASANIKYFD